MRIPTEDELAGLRFNRELLQIHLDSAVGETANPKVVAVVAWIDDVLQTAGDCQEWPVEVDGPGCAACLGEHDGLCTIAEQRDMRLRVSREFEQPAPKACPLRAGASFIVGAE
jgi:hypothetical protein